MIIKVFFQKSIMWSNLNVIYSAAWSMGNMAGRPTFWHCDLLPEKYEPFTRPNLNMNLLPDSMKKLDLKDVMTPFSLVRNNDFTVFLAKFCLF